MPILPGTHLGPYEVLSAIGAGGMGEVYKARDTRLDRIVAIKVLPAHLADRAELRERFDREAKTIASLNHPHICTLYDTGHQDGIDFLVMEYLAGETLAQRLAKGSLPIHQVLQYSIEISDALDKAHRKGITHRDLKPGNIMLTKSGAKLLDFGLAKLRQEAAPATPLSQLPTVAETVTAQGMILGTLQYMAPEQVEGKTDEVDARTDIFAFGAVVYEMATGRRAFEGASQASLIAKILETDPPPMSSIQSMTPPALDRVVRKCLAKDAEKRWQSAADLTDELQWISNSASQVTPLPNGSVATASQSGGRNARLGLIGSLVLALATGFAVWSLKPSATVSRPVFRSTIALPPGDRLAPLDQPVIALSPDGARLVYAEVHDGVQQLYLRRLDSLDAFPIPGTEGGTAPFFSPDGKWIGFADGGALKKIPVEGGIATALITIGLTRGASWTSQGTIFFSNAGSSVRTIPDAGGAPKLLVHLDTVDAGSQWPEVLPGGQAVIFAGGVLNNPMVVAYEIRSNSRRLLAQAGTQPRYAASGHLVYAQGGNLLAVPFDPAHLQVAGQVAEVVKGVAESEVSGAAQYSLSNTGTLAYVPGGVVSARSTLVWVDRKGKEVPLAKEVRSYDNPRLSPDGKRIAVSIDGQIWIYEIAREALTRLTIAGSMNDRPVWTPDGKRLAFYSNKEGPLNIFWQAADGSGQMERLAKGDFTQVPQSFSPDGQVLSFHEVNPSTGTDIWMLHVGDLSQGSGQVRKAEPFLRTPLNESDARFSPDGRWIAYLSDESGRTEVYVQSYPGPGGKWQLSTDGGTEPAWNPNGRELFYRNEDKVMAVAVITQPAFSVGKPTLLFQGDYLLSPVRVPNYDVSSDGQRFLMVKSSKSAEASPAQINVVLNWFEELKRLAPSGTK